jgi:hypothetical protein
MAKTKTTNAGRPTDYNPHLVTITKEYVGGGFKKMKDEIPTIAGLALCLGVARGTIYEWCKDVDKREFSDTIESLLSDQERLLVNGGVRGLYNSTITKLMLSSNHGYAERTEHTGADGTPLVDLTKALKEIIKRQ